MTCPKQGRGCGAYVRCCIKGRIHVEAVALAVSPAWVLVEAEAGSEAFEGEQVAAQKRYQELRHSYMSGSISAMNRSTYFL